MPKEGVVAIKRQRSLGFTFLELLLALVVCASLLMAGYRQYVFFRQDVDLLDLQANVDTIMSAMALYYKQNCYGQVNPYLDAPYNFTPGTLHPSNDLPLHKAITLQKDLVTPGLLSTTLPQIVRTNPLVDTSKGEYGYIVQFNQYTQPRYICQEAQNVNKPATGPEPAQNCKTKVQVGTILMWRPQVAVALKNTTATATYLAVTGADCLSDVDGSDSENNVVYPCAANKPGNYLVWERSPSLAAVKSSANFWQMLPTVQQFNQMYTTYPMNYLMTPKSDDTTGNTPNDKQYFLCGG